MKKMIPINGTFLFYYDIIDWLTLIGVECSHVPGL